MSEVKNQVEAALEAAQVFLLSYYSSWPTGAKDPVFSDGQAQLCYIKVKSGLAALSHPAPDVPEPTFPDIEPWEYTFGPGRKAPGAEEIEAIRARHEADEQASEEGDGVPPLRLIAAHIDRGDLLRLLDAAREELREVKEAAGPFVEAASHHSADTSDSYCIENMYPGLTLGDLRRLAAALKAPATRARRKLVKTLREKLNDIPQLKRGQVWCRTCGHTQKVNGPGAVLGGGWPKCCGYTMTIDNPEEQRALAAAPDALGEKP